MDNLESNYLRPSDAKPARPKLRLTKIFFRNFLSFLNIRGILIGTTLSAAVAGIWISLEKAMANIPNPGGNLPWTILFIFLGYMYACGMVLQFAFAIREIAIKRSQETGRRKWVCLGPNPAQTVQTVLLTTLATMAPALAILSIDFTLEHFHRGPFPNNYEIPLTLTSAIFTVFIGYALFGAAPLISAIEGVTPFRALQRALELTKRNRLKTIFFVGISTLLWLGAYFIYYAKDGGLPLFLPGALLFEWHRLNIVALYNELKEKTATDQSFQSTLTSPTIAKELESEEQKVNA